MSSEIIDLVDIEIVAEPESDPARDMARVDADNTVSSMWGHLFCLVPLIALCLTAYF